MSCIKENIMRNFKLSLSALFTALIAIGAFFKITIPGDDYFTLQFFFVVLSGMLLGAKLGSISVATYVLLGLFGLPIFAAGGGFAYVLRPSFGYLIGFIFSSCLAGFLSKKFSSGKKTLQLVAALSALLPTYSIGWTYKYFILKYYVGESIPFNLIIAQSLPLDLPADILCCCLAGILMSRLGFLRDRISNDLSANK